jgi:protein ImuA
MQIQLSEGSEGRPAGIRPARFARPFGSFTPFVILIDPVTAMSSPSSLLPLEHLHPALWRAHQLGRGREAVQASGYAALDAELPGGGWPQGAITELLLAGSGWGEVRLLAPALARVGAGGRGVLLIGPPAEPCAEALAQLGLALSRCVVIRGADLLWPLEQALRSGQAGAVVAWAPASLKSEALRRLHLAAQSHEGPAFVIRSPAAAAQPSPAPLRLALSGAGPDAMAVRLLKRRGPALDQALLLALPPVLSRTARARAATPRHASVPALSTIA